MPRLDLNAVTDGYRLEDYDLHALKRDPATTIQLEQLADY